jgi:hypothetical protein
MLDTQEALCSMELVIFCYTVALLSAEINQQELRFLKAETMECANVRKELFFHLYCLELRFIYGITVLTDCMEHSPP